MHWSTLLCLKNHWLVCQGSLEQRSHLSLGCLLGQDIFQHLGARSLPPSTKASYNPISPFLFFFDPTDRVFTRSPEEEHTQFRGCFPFLVLPVYDIWFPFQCPILTSAIHLPPQWFRSRANHLLSKISASTTWLTISHLLQHHNFVNN